MKLLVCILNALSWTAVIDLRLPGQSAPPPAQILPPQTVAFCDLVRTPERYHKTVVRTQAILLEGPEHSMLYDPGCMARENLTWLEWEGYAQALKVTSNRVRERLNNYARLDHRVKVTVVGIFEGKREVEVPKNARPEVGEAIKRNNEIVGFGHLGCCRFQIVPTTIDNVQRVSKSAPWP
jgi:hypothetical protein